MNVSDWSLVKKDKQSKLSEKDQVLIRSRLQLEVHQAQKPETFLFKVIQTLFKESESNSIQSLKIKEK